MLNCATSKKWIFSALLGASCALFTIPHSAFAIVPVHCPTFCETWDVALSGRIGDTEFRWFATKEIGPESGLGLGSLGGLGDIFGFITGLFGGSVDFLKDVLGIGDWDAIAWFFARLVLAEFSDGIVDWIRHGQSSFFTVGTDRTLFATNIDALILHGADNAASLFLTEYFGTETWNKLCTPFRLPVGLGISTSYGRGFGSFNFHARCTLTDVVANVESFYTSFTNGGWAAWMATSRYENNPWGLMTLANTQSGEREFRASRANSLDSVMGAGFLGQRKCVKAAFIDGGIIEGNDINLNDPNGNIVGCIEYKTVTPGRTVVHEMENALGQEVSKLANADEIDEALVSIFSDLFSWLISGGGDTLLGGGGGQQQRPSRPPLPACNDGRDNDNDGLFDMNDPGCTGSTDDSETDPPPQQQNPQQPGAPGF